MYLNMEALSDIYGWTTDEIFEQDPEILDIYMAILSGKSEAREAKVGNRKLKRELMR